MENKDTKIVIENTQDKVRIVNISYFNKTLVFSTDVFEKQEMTIEWLREGVEERLSNELDIEILVENKGMSFNDFVNQEVEEWDSNLDILGEVVAYTDKVDDTFNVFIYQDREHTTDNPFYEIIEKYHMKKVDTIPHELLRICDIVENDIDQEPMWYQNGMNIN